jgi:hypothetical protein
MNNKPAYDHQSVGLAFAAFTDIFPLYTPVKAKVALASLVQKVALSKASNGDCSSSFRHELTIRKAKNITRPFFDRYLKLIFYKINC